MAHYTGLNGSNFISVSNYIQWSLSETLPRKSINNETSIHPYFQTKERT